MCAQTRAFVVENVGFQRQLVELEAMMTRRSSSRAESPSATLQRASPVGGGSGSGSEPSEPLQWLSQMLPAEVTVRVSLRVRVTVRVRVRVLTLTLSLSLSLTLALALALSR